MLYHYSIIGTVKATNLCKTIEKCSKSAKKMKKYAKRKKPPLSKGGPDCRKRCAHPLAPSARGLRPQAVGERTVRLPEIFRAMARFSPSAPSGHLPRRGRFFDSLASLVKGRSFGVGAGHARPAALRQAHRSRADAQGRGPRHKKAGAPPA